MIPPTETDEVPEPGPIVLTGDTEGHLFIHEGGAHIIKVEVVRDDFPDLSHLGIFDMCETKGAISHDPSDNMSNDWFHSTNHEVHDPTSWDHVRGERRAQVIREHGSLEEADKAYAQRDYELMVSYDAGDWWMVSVVVTVYDAQGKEVGSASLGGIESTSGDHFKLVKGEMVAEALEDAGVVHET